LAGARFQALAEECALPDDMDAAFAGVRSFLEAVLATGFER